MRSSRSPTFARVGMLSSLASRISSGKYIVSSTSMSSGGTDRGEVLLGAHDEQTDADALGALACASRSSTYAFSAPFPAGAT